MNDRRCWLAIGVEHLMVMRFSPTHARLRPPYLRRHVVAVHSVVVERVRNRQVGYCAATVKLLTKCRAQRLPVNAAPSARPPALLKQKTLSNHRMRVDHSAFMPAARMTSAHFAMSASGLKRIPSRGGGEFQISNVGAET
jgi:hypothetical protein